MNAARSVNRQLVVLTAAKVVANTALRWVSPFLPVLQAAFATTTGTLTSVMGVAELGGLSTMLTGSVIDRGRERAVFVAGLGAVGLSCLIALGGSVATFAIAFAVLIVGVANLTVAAHAWIGNRVPLPERGRGIGVVETSWALALLVGAPVVALLIGRFGWRGPFVALACASVVAALVVVWNVPGAPARSAGEAGVVTHAPLGSAAWRSLFVSAATAASGIGIFVVSGVWLDERHGVSTAGLGVIAGGFGVVELGSSSAVAAVGDRVGTRRSIAMGLGVLLAGLGLMVGSGDVRAMAVAGLVVFLAGFEFAFVSSLALVTEAAPDARGRAIGIGNAVGTLARSAAVAAGGLAYEAFGIGGSVALSAAAAGVALGLILVPAGP